MSKSFGSSEGWKACRGNNKDIRNILPRCTSPLVVASKSPTRVNGISSETLPVEFLSETEYSSRLPADNVVFTFSGDRKVSSRCFNDDDDDLLSSRLENGEGQGGDDDIVADESFDRDDDDDDASILDDDENDDVG